MNRAIVSETRLNKVLSKILKRWSIAKRILAINVLALFILVTGLLYVGKYRQGLIESEISSLTVQAEMFAVALGESAVIEDSMKRQGFNVEISNQIIRRLVTTTGTQAQLISRTGNIVSDSRLISEPGGVVQIEELPPVKEEDNFVRYILDVFDKSTWQLVGDYLTLNSDNTMLSTLPIDEEVDRAMQGEIRRMVSISNSVLQNVSVAVPVQRYKRVLGVLALTKNASEINDAVYQVRLEILRMFGVALLVAILLSTYLARTIAKPIRQLAATANKVSRSLSRQYNIPDLSRRTDEVGDLSIALRSMTDALWKRMDSVEQFAADVAHEIKNPLTSIRSAVETATKVKTEAELSKLLSIILNDIQRLDRLISDIADASRLDSELSRAKMMPTDLRTLVIQFDNIYKALDKASETTLNLNIPSDEKMMVLGIEDRILQVLRNIISNAESFSKKNTEINVTVRRAGKYFMLTVEDQGPGISIESMPRVFDRFYKERPSNETFGTHSGLGLNISKQIIETHGGQIWVENIKSTQNKILGARFIFTLPAMDL